MKGMVGSQSWKQADACWTGDEDGRTWPEVAVLHRVGISGTSGDVLDNGSETCVPERPETRLEKIYRLRAAILRGEYHVPAGAIAERLLQAMFDRSN